jgi:hypothetical protein
MLSHIVPTVHGIERLLVAWEVCAHSHFICSVGGMSSFFSNVELVSPILIRNKWEVSLYIYVYFCGEISMMYIWKIRNSLTILGWL